MIQIQVDKSKLERYLKESQVATKKAVVRALNRAVSAVFTQAKKDIAADTGIKQKDIGKKMYMIKAKPDRQEAIWGMSVRGVPLYAFRPRTKVVQTRLGKRQGVTVDVEGIRYLVPGGFVAQMKGGKTGVFARNSGERLPIKELKYSQLAKLIKDRGYLDRYRALGQERFERTFEADFKYYVSK